MNIQTGDVLLYKQFDEGFFLKLFEKLTDIGEHMEIARKHIAESEYFYHAAIAYSENSRLEANGSKVSIDPIVGNQYEVFRLPYIPETIEKAIEETKQKLGENYNWLEIADDGLRDLTNDELHVPDRLMKHLFNHQVVCSRLLAFYLFYLGERIDPYAPNISPEDIYELVKAYKVG